MLRINNFFLLVLIFCFVFVCGCVQSDDISNPSSIETSGVPTESRIENDNSFSEQSTSIRDDKMSECIVMTTDKTEYTINDKVTINISTNHKYEHGIQYGREFYIEYFENGEWNKCKKEYEWQLEALTLGPYQQYETTLTFDIEERIDEGYEKYRFVNEFFSQTHNNALIYSNEFTLVP